jgi:hypothetical protein
MQDHQSREMHKLLFEERDPSRIDTQSVLHLLAGRAIPEHLGHELELKCLSRAGRPGGGE